MAKVIVFGTGQPASVNYYNITHNTPHEVVAFTVDKTYINNQNNLFNLPIVAFEDIQNIFPPEHYKMSIRISYRNMNKLRADKYLSAKKKGYQFLTYISPNAIIPKDLEIGENSFIYEGAIVMPFTKIGNNVCIGVGSCIGHHSLIEDHCFIGPHSVVLGSTTIKSHCLIGANSTIKDGGITIEKECLIGAGTVITKNTKEKEVYLPNNTKLAVKNSEEFSKWLTFGM